MISLAKQSSVLFILCGIIFLALYRVFVGEAYGLLLFVASAVSLSLGVNRLAIILERRIRKTNNIRFPFARIFYFLVPYAFAFYLFYTFQEFVPRLILAISIMVLVFLSIYSFGSAISRTSFARRRMNFLYGLLSVIGFCFLLSFLSRNTGVLLLLPLIVMLLFADYLQFIFFREVGRPYYFGTILATGLLAIVFDILLVMNWMTPDTISAFYGITITVYMGLFAAAVAVMIYILTQRMRRPDFYAATVMPVLGVVLACLVFTAITSLGTLIGTQIDNNICQFSQ